MNVSEVLGLFLARRENYSVSTIRHLHGDMYSLVMDGQSYTAVVLLKSFDYYVKRYHLAKNVPTLVICFQHNTALPIHALAMLDGEITKPFELPSEITDIEVQRVTKLGHKVLLGMYLSGMKLAQDMVKHLPDTTRKRYVREAETYGKRTRGKPVGLPPKIVRAS